MVTPHFRLNWLARWLRRCPQCGAWGKLHITQHTNNLSGKHRDYKCRQCGAAFRDWKPSTAVKF